MPTNSPDRFPPLSAACPTWRTSISTPTNSTGRFPPALGNLARLTHLDLSANELTGPIPALSSLPNLVLLYLHTNQLRGPIPDLRALSNLTALYLHTNQLGLDTNGQKIATPNLNTRMPTSLTALHLSANELGGPIPDLSRLTSLRYLHLGANELTGPIPDLRVLRNLDELHLHTNQLGLDTNGRKIVTPDLDTRMPTSLRTLDLNFNKLSGPLPDMSDLPALVYFYIRNNDLRGPLPDMSDLDKLGQFSISNNELGLTQQGEQIAAPLAGLAAKLPASLTRLWLSDNGLSGELPDLSTLTALQRLYLDTNQLGLTQQGEQITTPLAGLANKLPASLRWLELQDNALSGAIPALSLNLSALYLHNNALSGAIPAFSAATGTFRLSLYGNPGLYGYPPDLNTKTALRLLAPGDGTAVCLYGDADGAAGTTDCTVPTRVDKLRVQASPTQLDFSWTPHPADPPPHGHAAQYYPPGGPWTDVPTTGTQTAPTATLTGLTPGATYSFLVRTADQPTSPQLYYIATLPLAAPTGLRVIAGNTRLTLRWTAPTGATGYDVHYKTTTAPDQPATSPTDPDTGWVAVIRTGDTPVQAIPGLTNGTAYNVRVRAKNAGGNSVWATSQGTPRRPSSPPPPRPPTGGGPGGGGGGGGSRPPADQHGDTPATATALTPAGQTGALSRTIDAHLQSRSDVDYFTLNLPHAGVLIARTTGGDTTGRLYQVQDDDTPVLLAEDTARGPFEVGVAVEPGTYYLAVSAGASGGDYRLTVDYTPAFVDNPAPDSPQSGLGVLSGWVCAADTVEIELVPENGETQTLVPATGTSRADTAGVCGAATTATGFGLLFNWNLLGDGAHTVRVLIADVVFAERQVTVTTLGAHPAQEYRRGLRATTEIADFPDVGQTTTLRWEEALQNFVIAHGERGSGGEQLTPEQAWLENPAPGSFQSGLGVISGWVCEADTVEIVFEPGGTDDTLTFEAGSGTERLDTADRCGDTDNGFGLLFNWNLLGDGQHTVRAYADGEAFAHSTVTVTPLDGEFARGLRGTHEIADFPAPGQRVTVEWHEGPQNFVVTGVE